MRFRSSNWQLKKFRSLHKTQLMTITLRRTRLQLHISPRDSARNCGCTTHGSLNTRRQTRTNDNKTPLIHLNPVLSWLTVRWGGARVCVSSTRAPSAGSVPLWMSRCVAKCHCFDSQHTRIMCIPRMTTHSRLTCERKPD